MVVTFRAPIAPVEAGGGPEGGTEKSSEKSREKSSEKILDLVRQNPAFSAREIAEALGLTSRAVEKQLGKLKKEGRLKRIGPDKGGHWEVVP
jgi:ATP-dependent DNA helicase RecG